MIQLKESEDKHTHIIFLLSLCLPTLITLLLYSTLFYQTVQLTDSFTQVRISMRFCWHQARANHWKTLMKISTIATTERMHGHCKL